MSEKQNEAVIEAFSHLNHGMIVFCRQKTLRGIENINGSARNLQSLLRLFVDWSCRLKAVHFMPRAS